MKSLGDRIKARRKSHGLSQGKLARRADMDQSLLCRIESGDTKNPGINAVAALAQVLGCSIDYLYGLSEDVTDDATPPLATTAP